MKRHLNGDPGDRIQKFVRAAGLLPHGQVGVTLFEQELPGIGRFAQRLQEALPVTTRCSLNVDLRVGEWHLMGQLADVTPQGLVGYRLSGIRPRDYLNLWVRHLLFNCLAPDDVQHTSRWLGEDKELLLRVVEDPQTRLQELLAWYWQGLHRPLHFFPESSFAYADARREGKPDPLRGAHTKWEGSAFHRGEGEDSYYRLVFRDQTPLDAVFVTVADAVFLPLFAHLQEG